MGKCEEKSVENALECMEATVRAIHRVLLKGALSPGWHRSMKQHEPLMNTVDRCRILAKDLENAISCINRDSVDDLKGIAEGEANEF